MNDQPTGNRPASTPTTASGASAAAADPSATLHGHELGPGAFVIFRCQVCPWESSPVDAHDRTVQPPDYEHFRATGHRKSWQLVVTCRESTIA